jgi:cysteinyl-tRNA synthetase
VIKLVDKKELLLERERIKEQEEKKRLEKIKKKEEADAKQAALDAIRKIPPFEMFKSETDKYSKFDDKVRIFTFYLCSTLKTLFNSKPLQVSFQ